MTDVAVIDYGMGNLLSVCRALSHLGASPRLVASVDALGDPRHVVLPGVGAFVDGMRELTARGLDRAVLDHAAKGRPLLGICLGMQMLFDRSHEFGETAGLSLIPGSVEPIPADGRKIPHIGWNALHASPEQWQGGLLAGVPEGTAVYFVHSFMAVPVEPSDLWAWADHDGCRVSAVVGRGLVAGCQFHPEKSGPNGLRILGNFLSW